MTKRILVDATHTEETRVAVVDGQNLIDVDYESSLRKQLKGSIFLAKITRIEPSLQAAFVNFGGNRHGFLPFSEIHPDYFRIPIADREALIEEQKAEMSADEDEDDDVDDENDIDASADDVDEDELEDSDEDIDDTDDSAEDDDITEAEKALDEKAKAIANKDPEAEENDADGNKTGKSGRFVRGRKGGRGRKPKYAGNDSKRVEIVGGDIAEGEQTRRPKMRKNYKIQEVTKRGQIVLVQAQKEERGNKGAAVTTYLSLPGRYCVLMPNSPRGGGVSRKVSNYQERKRLRELLKEFEIPDGMSVILRTAGVSRTKTEIKRDLDYLMRLWDDIRNLTLKSIAPEKVYEEGNLIKRALRDIYTRDIEEVVIAGEETHKEAKKIMKMLIPSHVKRVIKYDDNAIPLFQKFGVETQIAKLAEPEAHMKSGGSIVINPTEALVAIDVNSGKSTKERHIEETALRTNLEAADEVARQLKLRDLGGLVVIDFIDMENRRNNSKVERRLRDALSSDRARIQIGRISNFGLLELSRQRLNPSLTEAQFKKCAHCEGSGIQRTEDSAALLALRALEAEGIKKPGRALELRVPNNIALFILNHKRDMLSKIEQQFELTIKIVVDRAYEPVNFAIFFEGKEILNSKTPTSTPNKSHDGGHKNDQKPNNRRGRRGGRNRRDKNHDGAQQNNSQNNAQNNNQGSTQDATQKPDDTSKADVTDGAKPEPKTRRTASKKAATKQPETVETTEEKPVKKVAKKTAPKKKKDEGASAKEASNDSAPIEKDTGEKETVKKPKKVEKAEEAPKEKDYEVVNEAPKKKKKGWWSKG